LTRPPRPLTGLRLAHDTKGTHRMAVPGLPEGKRFAFTIFDDTDGSTLQNTKPVYDLLDELGIRSTKSVWVFRPRGTYTGASLQDDEYLAWIRHLQDRGFEIALHNVGDGAFSRDEIVTGFAEFERLLGNPPTAHCNHAGNVDNLYWWSKRLEWPVPPLYDFAYRLIRRSRPKVSQGDVADSPHFWGDLAKRHVRYVRNLVFNDIDTRRADPRMPYHVASKPWVNHWFSSSDGHDARVFTDLLDPANVDRLEEQGGVSIVYTHFAFGFVDERGEVDARFRERITYLASKGTGWFVPVTPLLDHLASQRSTEDPGWAYRFGLNLRWLVDRARKRVRYRL
jgi:hypothetical protein